MVKIEEGIITIEIDLGAKCVSISILGDEITDIDAYTLRNLADALNLAAAVVEEHDRR